ncbi:hypothetical protein ACWCQM_40915 [Streptomyces sp. NPDC002125]
MAPKKVETAAEARSFAEWVELTGPTEVMTYDDGTTFFRVVRVIESRHVETFDSRVRVCRLGVLRQPWGEWIFAYDADGHLVALWASSRPNWVRALIDLP